MKINIRDVFENGQPDERERICERPQPQQPAAETDTEQEGCEVHPAPEEKVCDADIHSAAVQKKTGTYQAQGPAAERRLSRDIAAHLLVAAMCICLTAAVIICMTMIPREVDLTVDGEKKSVTSYSGRVGGFLEEQGIELDEGDHISVPESAFIYDGMEIDIEFAAEFRVRADGKTVACDSLKETVGEALEDNDIKLGRDDIVIPAAESALADGMEIVVRRVEFREKKVQEKVPFDTVTKNDDSLESGSTRVVRKGKNGRELVTYRVKLVDGKEVSRKVKKRSTLIKAVDKVIAKGTKFTFNGQDYSRKLVVKAYSYTGGGTTAMGTPARVGEIAVDPSVIPLGSNVYIEGVGPRRAEDTGGNIKGNTIDIYMNTLSECRNWGARYVTIYIE